MALPAIRATDSEGNNVLGVGFIGDSAYQTAVKNGFEGTEQEWLESLRGPQGKEGPPGPEGPKGADGTMSFEELTDEQKEELRGPQGIQGPPGPAGATGAQGDQGPAGPQGPKGDTYTITSADYSAIADVVFSKMTNASEVRY